MDKKLNELKDRLPELDTFESIYARTHGRLHRKSQNYAKFDAQNMDIKHTSINKGT